MEKGNGKRYASDILSITKHLPSIRYHIYTHIDIYRSSFLKIDINIFFPTIDKRFL